MLMQNCGIYHDLVQDEVTSCQVQGRSLAHIC